jgi:hypothetical protein
MHHANLEKLKFLRLFGMARALQELTGLDDRASRPSHWQARYGI